MYIHGTHFVHFSYTHRTHLLHFSYIHHTYLVHTSHTFHYIYTLFKNIIVFMTILLHFKTHTLNSKHSSCIHIRLNPNTIHSEALHHHLTLNVLLFFYHHLMSEG